MNRRPFIQVLLGLLGLRVATKPGMQPFLDYTRKVLRERFQTDAIYGNARGGGMKGWRSSSMVYDRCIGSDGKLTPHGRWNAWVTSPPETPEKRRQARAYRDSQ